MPVAAIDKRIIVALDYPDKSSVLAFADSVSPDLCRLKVGKEVFTHSGPELVTALIDRGFDVFLDLKFHDIPTTVAKAVSAALDLGVWMLNVHALGGSKMMTAAREALERQGSDARLIAVTVLTSMQDSDLAELGLNMPAAQLAAHLAGLAKQCGLHGVVCSAQEASAIASQCGEAFLRVTPGIRPANLSSGDDQRRTMNPRQAVDGGSSYLVIGRPVTQSNDPVATLLAIKKEIGEDGGEG
ncbi:MAG: orotidine-5'-phosphate decarboxylase [Gammaproteobacteria bacterium]|nr:orotidine-5'-phosphate decarboxylase [Gammaproteobacteria bacterium]MBQ0838601.1 orotidine-5'-phosphate decarboxylase [Gammaproteobacteria bacterium]